MGNSHSQNTDNPKFNYYFAQSTEKPRSGEAAQLQYIQEMNPSVISPSFRGVSIPGNSAGGANPAQRAVLTEQGTFPVFPVPQHSPVPPVCSFHRSLVSRDKAALPLPSGRNSATGRYLEAQQKKRRDGA